MYVTTRPLTRPPAHSRWPPWSPHPTRSRLLRLSSYIHSIAHVERKVKRKIPGSFTLWAREYFSPVLAGCYGSHGISEFWFNSSKVPRHTGTCITSRHSSSGLDMALALPRNRGRTSSPTSVRWPCGRRVSPYFKSLSRTAGLCSGETEAPDNVGHNAWGRGAEDGIRGGSP